MSRTTWLSLSAVATLAVVVVAGLSSSSAKGRADCAAEAKKVIADGYNEGGTEVVSIEGPYKWREKRKTHVGFVVTYCEPGDTSSAKRRAANCKRTRGSELRIARCAGTDVADINRDDVIDLSDFVRGRR